jgi:phage terminase large subunit-like protein
MRDYEQITNQYALDIVTGKIPASELTKLTFKRHLSDLERSKNDPNFEFVFNPTLIDRKGREFIPGNKICKFAESLQHVTGELEGEPIVLEPWQIALLSISFGWINKHTGYRRFKEFYAEVPRKNGKSVLGWIIGLYMLAPDGEGGAHVYSGATSQKQAMEVFAPAWHVCNRDKELCDYFGIQVHGTRPDFGSITIDNGICKFIPLIGNPGDGKNPHCYICDEFHEHPNGIQYNALSLGMGSRRQSMKVIITTAGVNLAGPCYAKRGQVVKILECIEGFENDSIFGVIYTINDDDDWTDFNNWIKANPNFGVSVFEDFLRDQLKNAIQIPSQQSDIRCKNLNQWMNAGTQFFDILKLENKCADRSLKIEEFTGVEMFGGADIASKRDLAGYVNLFRRYENEDWHYYAFCKAYLPEAAVEGEENSHYHGWKEEGWLTVTPGARTDIQRIQDEMEEDDIIMKK